MTAPIVSVVAPAHNEEASLESVVRDVACSVVEAVGVRGIEMIVVDDASSDATPAVLQRLASEFDWLRVLTMERNVGHGPAVAAGLHQARGEWVFQLDADAQFVVADFGRLWSRRDEAVLVLGVRTHRHDAGHRLLLSKVAAAFATSLGGRRLQDVNCPFRLYRRFLWSEAAAVAGPAPAIPSVVTCMTASRLGLPIAEVEVTHLARIHGRSTLNLRRLVPLVLRGTRELAAARVRLARAGAHRT